VTAELKPKDELPILHENSNAAEGAVAPPPPRKKLYDLLTRHPFAGSELNLERQKDYPRPVDL